MHALLDLLACCSAHHWQPTRVARALLVVAVVLCRAGFSVAEQMPPLRPQYDLDYDTRQAGIGYLGEAALAGFLQVSDRSAGT